MFVLALAGRFAASRRLPLSAGTLPTHRPLFVGLLTGVALVVVGLTYVPALALGPIVESLVMTKHPAHEIDPRLAAAASCSQALPDAVRKLDPRELRHHPVMLVVEIGAVATTVHVVARPVVLGWPSSRSGCG